MLTLTSQKKNLSLLHTDDARVSTPTATEKTLPWKRDNEGEEEVGIKQHEFPSWVSNKEYLAYHSPSATFLGKFLGFFVRFIIFFCEK